MYYHKKGSIEPKTFSVDTDAAIVRSIDNTCSICNDDKALYSHKEDFTTKCPFPIYCESEIINGKHRYFPTNKTSPPKRIEFRNNKDNHTIPTLCEDCIRYRDIKNTSLDDKVILNL